MWFQGESGPGLVRKGSSQCQLRQRVHESQKVRSRKKTRSKMNEPESE